MLAMKVSSVHHSCHHGVQDDEQLDSEDEDEGQALSNAKELAGMRVRHDADELGEGETMILMLADRNILDEHGEVDADKDELENALVVRTLRWLPLCADFVHLDPFLTNNFLQMPHQQYGSQAVQ